MHSNNEVDTGLIYLVTRQQNLRQISVVGTYYCLACVLILYILKYFTVFQFAGLLCAKCCRTK